MIKPNIVSVIKMKRETIDSIHTRSSVPVVLVHLSIFTVKTICGLATEQIYLLDFSHVEVACIEQIHVSTHQSGNLLFRNRWPSLEDILPYLLLNVLQML